MRFHRLWMMAALALAVTVSANAQEQRAPKPETGAIEKIQIETMMPPASGDAVMSVSGPNTFVFVNSELSFESKTVKGAPYSAEATTETIQTLSDGNRIIRKNSATIYRDGEGRTRREQTLSSIGPWTAAGDPPRSIFINDPVARVNYMLDPKTQTYRKMSIAQLASGGTFTRVLAPPPPVAPAAPMVTGTANVRVYDIGTPAPNTEPLNREQPKVESLGKQVIEGVEAEGTRTTITIPAGKIGNEREINIVSERWFSPELQVVVYSKRSDPMSGETIYKLTNINRDEPARSLFEVPAGYTVRERPDANYLFREREVQRERRPQQ
jgi:hypothetical protein